MSNVAFVFPGQGSQSVGMLDNVDSHSKLSHYFNLANQVLGVDLLKMVNLGPAEDLNKTQWTQPALLTASVAIFELVKSQSELNIKIMAGHSLGEYSALVCSGALDFEQAVQLVHKRGKYMQDSVATGTGSMAAVLGLEEELLEQACAEAGGIVSPANYNSPGQIVIAGEAEAVIKASELAMDKGAKKVMPLAVSVPSHCQLMESAAERLAADLAEIEIKVPNISIIHNVDVKSHNDPDLIKNALVAQLFSPVRWSQTMSLMQTKDIDTIVECGPGKVLSGLFKRFDRSLNIVPLLNQKGIDKLITETAG